jgi:hypothetical protein
MTKSVGMEIWVFDSFFWYWLHHCWSHHFECFILIIIHWLTVTEYMGVSDNHGYVSFVVDTQSQYLSSFLDQNQRWLITGYFTWVTRRGQIVEQELLIFAEYLGSSWFIVVFLLLNLYISVFCVALTTACCFVLMIYELAVLYRYRLLSTLFVSFKPFLCNISQFWSPLSA